MDENELNGTPSHSPEEELPTNQGGENSSQPSTDSSSNGNGTPSHSPEEELPNNSNHPQSANIPVQSLAPFTRFCCSLGMIPSSYKVAMTYEEQLMWLCNYLETVVIPTVNNNTDVTNEVQELFNQLHDYVENYFTNLDVQQEINNKLDKMASDGTLISIIAPYLQPFINEQNNRISQVENFVYASTNINPLVATSIEQMTDTTRIYVLTTDGYWYYYDGDSWEQGGVYQATVNPEVENIRIGADGTEYPTAGEAVRTQFNNMNAQFDDIATRNSSSNLLNMEEITENKVISTSGTIINSDSTFVTPLIPCNYNDIFYITYINPSNVFTPISSAVCFNYALYDEEMNLLKRENYKNSIAIELSLAKFIRFTFNNTLLDYTISLTKNEYPTTRNEVELYFPETFIPKEPKADINTQEIVSLKNNLLQIVTPINWYNEDAITEGKVISTSGPIIDSDSTFVTDFIPVKKDDIAYITYINSSNVFRPISSAVCFNYAVYDNNKNMLSRGTNANSIEITDNDAKWIRFTFNNALLNCVISLTINQYPSSASEIQEYFEPYFIPKEPLAQELQQEIENIEARKGTLKIIKSTTTIDIYVPLQNSDNFMHFTYSYISNNNINMNQWRMNHIEVVNKNLTQIFELSNGSEWDGVVKESNTDDFIGGYHGDETNQYLNILADGVEMDSTTSSSWQLNDITELKIVNKSILNRCNTPNDNLFTRYKVHTFTKDDLKIFNRWIALQNVTLQYSYLTMMGMDEFNSNNYPIGKYARNNDNFIIQENPGEAISGGPLSNSFFADTMEFWNDDGFYASVQSIPNYDNFGSTQEHAVRLDRSQTDRVKAYFSYLRSNTQIPQDRELIATSIFKFLYKPTDS